MKWHHPPIIKIYEALGSVADGRVELSGEDKNKAKVYSSTGNKYYDIAYDPEKKAIMANDNASYWKGYLGYPSIAYLMKVGVLSYDPEMGKLLEGIAWKDINQKFKNDFDKTLGFILSTKTAEEKNMLGDFVEKVDGEIKALNLGMLGKKMVPPEGY
jgi:hypothetical protein